MMLLAMGLVWKWLLLLMFRLSRGSSKMMMKWVMWLLNVVVVEEGFLRSHDVSSLDPLRIDYHVGTSTPPEKSSTGAHNSCRGTFSVRCILCLSSTLAVVWVVWIEQQRLMHNAMLLPVVAEGWGVVTSCF